MSAQTLDAPSQEATPQITVSQEHLRGLIAEVEASRAHIYRLRQQIAQDTEEIEHMRAALTAIQQADVSLWNQLATPEQFALWAKTCATRGLNSEFQIIPA